MLLGDYLPDLKVSVDIDYVEAGLKDFVGRSGQLLFAEVVLALDILLGGHMAILTFCLTKELFPDLTNIGNFFLKLLTLFHVSSERNKAHSERICNDKSYYLPY